jgi:hypothetical protein
LLLYRGGLSATAGGVHLSSGTMIPPLGPIDVQFFEELAGRPEFFRDRSLEFFRLLAEPLEAHHQALWLSGAR